MTGQLLRRIVAAAACVPAVARAQTYDVVRAEHDLMIPVRDGARMATDIYRPARDGVVLAERLPVLLIRTPYDKGAQQHDAEYFARHGYVVVAQDVRGRYRSEGRFLKVQPKDATDGYDVIEWLAKQPYCNGSVGMWGTSFAAHTQAGAAQDNPPPPQEPVGNNVGLSDPRGHRVRYCGTYAMGPQVTRAGGALPAHTPHP